MNLKEQRLKDKEDLMYHLVTTAVEGGSNHWLEMFALSDVDGNELSYRSKFLQLPAITTAFITADDFENGDTRALHLTGIAPYVTGLRKWTRWRFNRNQPIKDWASVDFDAEDADVFMQYALLGEIVYG
jgi:hypothetical protein